MILRILVRDIVPVDEGKPFEAMLHTKLTISSQTLKFKLQIMKLSAIALLAVIGTAAAGKPQLSVRHTYVKSYLVAPSTQSSTGLFSYFRSLSAMETSTGWMDLTQPFHGKTA